MSEDAEPDAQLSRRTPRRPGADLPVKQAVDPGRKLLPGTAIYAAATYHGIHATTEIEPRLEAIRTLECVDFFALSH